MMDIIYKFRNGYNYPLAGYNPIFRMKISLVMIKRALILALSLPGMRKKFLP